MRSVAANAVARLSQFDPDQLPPSIRGVIKVVNDAAQLFSDIKTDVMEFYQVRWSYYNNNFYLILILNLFLKRNTCEVNNQPGFLIRGVIYFTLIPFCVKDKLAVHRDLNISSKFLYLHNNNKNTPATERQLSECHQASACRKEVIFIEGSQHSKYERTRK